MRGVEGGTQPPGESARDRRGEATREMVLGAAIALFSEQGFEGTSLGAIAERAGVGTPLIVYHFESKEKLWRAGVDEVWRRMETTLVQGLAREGVRSGDQEIGRVDREGLRAVLRAFARSSARHPEYLRILLREGSHRGPRFDWLVAHHTRRNYEAGISLFRAARDRGVFPDVPLPHLLYLVAGALNFALAIAPDVEALTGQDPRSERFLDDHVDALLTLLAPTQGVPERREPPCP